MQFFIISSFFPKKDDETDKKTRWRRTALTILQPKMFILSIFGGARGALIECGGRFWDSVVSKWKNKREVWIILSKKNHNFHKKHKPEKQSTHVVLEIIRRTENLKKMKISKIISGILASAYASAGMCPTSCDCTNENKVVICAFKGLKSFPDISKSPDIEDFMLVNNEITSLPRLANQERGFKWRYFWTFIYVLFLEHQTLTRT